MVENHRENLKKIVICSRLGETVDWYSFVIILMTQRKNAKRYADRHACLPICSEPSSYTSARPRPGDLGAVVMPYVLEATRSPEYTVSESAPECGPRCG